MKKETFLVKTSEDIWWASQCIRDLNHQIHFWIRNIERGSTLLKKILSYIAMNMKREDQVVKEDEKAPQLMASYDLYLCQWNIIGWGTMKIQIR
uniref:Uncharacterized protein n=1 Tax=Castor canadensis TaxID=51338 RepID=A0A8C0W635_CASCN